MMSKPKAIRWFVRMIWLVIVVVGYRSLVDFGPQGSSGHNVQTLVMFGIYAAGDALLDWLWPWDRATDAQPGSAADGASRGS